MSIWSVLDQERRHQVQIAIAERKVDAPGANISGRDAQATRDLPLDVQVPLQFVRLRRIPLHVVAGSLVKAELDLIGEIRR